MLKVVKLLLGYGIIFFPRQWMRMAVRAFVPISAGNMGRGEQNNKREARPPSEQKETGGGKSSISQYFIIQAAIG